MEMMNKYYDGRPICYLYAVNGSPNLPMVSADMAKTLRSSVNGVI